MGCTLGPDQVAALAEDHERARLTVTPIDRVTKRYPGATLDDAYAIQQAWVDLQVAGGAVVRGHKIGLTSRAMQQAMRIDEPDFGALLDDMFVADGATVEARCYIDPKIEVELAFVLRHRIDGEDVTAADVYAATDHVTPALELIDARSHRIDPADGTPRTVRDTIADNAANAAIVTGGRPVLPGEIDLRWVPAILKRNGVVEETGVAAGVLDDPVNGVVWLARRLHRLGIALEAGETVLAGSFTRPVDLRAGDDIEVDFHDLGRITLGVA
jgi:2-oxo-hept-3-ene-1,7-dioate hydratase